MERTFPFRYAVLLTPPEAKAAANVIDRLIEMDGASAAHEFRAMVELRAVSCPLRGDHHELEDGASCPACEWTPRGAGESAATREALPIVGPCHFRDKVADVVDGLRASLASFESYVFPTQEITNNQPGLVTIESLDAHAILQELASAIEQLTTGEAIINLTDATHRTAIEAAARFCDRRSASLLTESKNPLAGTEAAKCATGIRRLADRASLARRPELTAEASHDD